MLPIPANIREVIIQLVPASIVNEITSYVFYDNHPKDVKEIDIIVCTKLGEVREYLNRELLCSINLNKISETSVIKILRNNKGDLFYLVLLEDELNVLSRKDKLEVHSNVTHVTNYEIFDVTCNGNATLKVQTDYSDGFLISDENFETFKYPNTKPPDSINLQLPIIKHLMSKVSESIHTVESIKITYKNFIEIRHTVSYERYKKVQPNLNDSLFKDNRRMATDAVKLHVHQAWIKSCNKKIIIAYDVCNGNDEYIHDVQILIHGAKTPSLEYTTKIFEKDTAAPFWKESDLQVLKPDTETTLVLVFNISELKNNILNVVEFNGVLVFYKTGIEYSIPIPDVNISSLITMGEYFDALCTDIMDYNLLLAVLASTVKTDLVMRHILKDFYSMEDTFTLDTLCDFLQMEKILNAENIVIFRKSPYHVLNGVMIVLKKTVQDSIAVTVYSRTSSQVLALIHLIHDVVPFPIVSTTPKYNIKLKTASSFIGDTNITGNLAILYNYKAYATSILNRTALVLNYLDNCMIYMNQSKNIAMRNRVRNEIDIFGQGELVYAEFKNKMWQEALNGMRRLKEVIPELMALSDLNMDLDSF